MLLGVMTAASVYEGSSGAVCSYVQLALGVSCCVLPSYCKLPSTKCFVVLKLIQWFYLSFYV